MHRGGAAVYGRGVPPDCALRPLTYEVLTPCHQLRGRWSKEHKNTAWIRLHGTMPDLSIILREQTTPNHLSE